ncbi:hypothetical protein C1752_09164 [Acaryochloris thomasi RCC1774]|uniref:Uncharacterized protein n=1 Tax=Acaryochloris thomasi RCC1774 TaxID=1764569 RepID=A0A2W1J9U1_9CYAN|nr:hypothetical protein C1752_09164 [Acaryochloris thomasi RCC1774]
MRSMAKQNMPQSGEKTRHPGSSLLGVQNYLGFQHIEAGVVTLVLLQGSELKMVG